MASESQIRQRIKICENRRYVFSENTPDIETEYSDYSTWFKLTLDDEEDNESGD